MDKELSNHEFQQKVLTFIDITNQRFNRIEDRFAKQDDRFAKQDDILSKILIKQDDHDKLFSEILDELKDHDESLKYLKNKVDAIDIKVGSLEYQIDDHFTHLDSRIDEIAVKKVKIKVKPSLA